MDICDLPGLPERVDWRASDCDGQWWSTDAETDENVNERMHSLMQRMLSDDQRNSCICVTHSNLIRRIMMRYGDVNSKDRDQNLCCDENPGRSDAHSNCTSLASWAEPVCSNSPSRSGSGMWEVLENSSRLLQRTKVDKLQNCGVIGV